MKRKSFFGDYRQKVFQPLTGQCLGVLMYRFQVRFYQASTSELYGKVLEVPQKETTQFYPR